MLNCMAFSLKGPKGCNDTAQVVAKRRPGLGREYMKSPVEAVKQSHLPVKIALFPSYFILPLRLHSRVGSPRQAEKG